MEEKTAVAMVRRNKLNGQKTITIPKKIDKLDEHDNIQIIQDEKGMIKLEKLNQ